MRYRKLDINGDFVFGHGSQDFLVNVPAAVGQAVTTGLQLFKGEFFMDTSAGVDYLGSVVGRNTGSLYDQVIRTQMQSTFGVLAINNYTSIVDTQNRSLSVTATVQTIFDGTTTVAAQVPVMQGGYGAGPYGVNPGYGE